MKETKIAKENIKWKIKSNANGYKFYWITRCESHKQTCQRWLGFLEEWFRLDCMDDLKVCNCKGCKFARKKITDLKQAIKLYEDAGI